MTSIDPAVFHDPDEVQLGVLGQGFIASVIGAGSVSRSVMVLTDRRVYQFGQLIDTVNDKRRFMYSTGRRVAALRDITGTAFHEVRPWGLLVYGLIVLFAGLACLLAANGASEEDSGVLAMFAILLFILSAFPLLGYLIKKRRYFVVAFSGDYMATECRWFKSEEIYAFQRAISLASDRLWDD